MAREALALSLVTCRAGFSGVVLIPLGRLQTSPKPLLARDACWFHHLRPQTGGIHGCSKRRAEKTQKTT